MRETGGLELASTITLVLQASRLTKCASQPSLVGNLKDHIRLVETKTNNIYRVQISYLQFAICEAFWQFANFFYIFSKNCESLETEKGKLDHNKRSNGRR